MLPVVRRQAEVGNGQALLRWLELDPAAATAFMRREVVRPEPRFSSLYLRLPVRSLPTGEQRQVAANFVALSAPEELVRTATLLHRYTTRATLSIVLPFIDRHLAGWPCQVQIPVLAYLLKVSPGEARPRLEQVLQKVSPPDCPQGKFLPSLGFMEASPVLDTLAIRQFKSGTPLAADAAEYLGKYGSAAMEPAVWEQLSRWHTKYVESGAELRMDSGKHMQDDWQLYNLDLRLVKAYVNAQGWTLSPEDVDGLSKLIGDKKIEELACTFSCGSELSVGPAPGKYRILYGRASNPEFSVDARIDYLMPTEPFHSSVNQYQCADLKSLKQKLLQFPAGSTFSITPVEDESGQGDWTKITAFLQRHGYSVRK